MASSGFDPRGKSAIMRAMKAMILPQFRLDSQKP
jgi:hypothetical protein